MNISFRPLFNAFFMCHRLPERSFFYKGRQFPICARCTGLAIGYVMSLAFVMLTGLLPLWLIILFIVPTVIDGGGQLLGYWQSTNSRRLVTGIFAGIGLLSILFHIAYAGMSFGQTVGMKWFH